MEIQKFEAYTYRGKGIKSNRNEVIHEIIDCFTDNSILGMEVSGTEYHLKDEILYLELWNKDGDINKTLKIDLSDIGIEIGTREWNEKTEEFDDFIPEVNLDTDITKQMKSYKKSIKNYNI
jgi:hypothetical protein